MRRRTFLSSASFGAAAVAAPGFASAAAASDRTVRFDRDYPGDLFLDESARGTFTSIRRRLRAVQSTIGHGRFHLVGIDEALATAAGYRRIGRFTRRELDLLESLFHADARAYGFYGRKVMASITDEIPTRAVQPVGGAGQQLYRGRSRALFLRMQAAVGDDLVLTSGVRGIVKQTYLFVAKATRVGFNLSRASRSLAPPGYSFHGTGDFDIGQRGYGSANFTAAFAQTPVYRRLVELGFVRERYPVGNVLGVRYEPWHVKVA